MDEFPDVTDEREPDVTRGLDDEPQPNTEHDNDYLPF